MILAFDPDSKNIGVAWGPPGKLAGVDVIRTQKGESAHQQLGRAVLSWLQTVPRDCLPFHEVTTIVVEGQRIRPRAPARPNDILLLGQMAGVLMGCLTMCDALSAARLVVPVPEEWKGQQPKTVNQARSYTSLGWTYQIQGSKSTGYCIPISGHRAIYCPTYLRPADWKHVGDAVGMALWAERIRA